MYSKMPTEFFFQALDGQLYSIIHYDANCFNPAVSAGLCCIYVILFSWPQGRIVILANCVTIYKNCKINK